MHFLPTFVVFQVREAFNKSLKRRREDARVRVEVVCDREEALKPMVKDNDGGVSHTPDAQSHHLSPALALLASAQGLPFTSPCPPRPEPVNGCVPLDGEIFGQVLELWGFLCTFSSPLKIVAIPTLNHFANALKACDPAYRHLQQHARGALHTFESVSAHAAATAAAGESTLVL